jgi:hypothetical protein
MYYFEERTLGELLRRCGFTDVRFIREHSAWTAQQTMDLANTHEPGNLRTQVARAVSRVGGSALARVLQRLGRQDILLCLATRAEHGHSG